MKRSRKSHNPPVAQSTRRATTNPKGNGNTSPPSPPSSFPPKFLVRVQGSDGKSEALIPIWIPLSIMGASAARNAGQLETVAEVVANTVIGHSKMIAQRYNQKSPPTQAVDVMAEIAMVSRKASQALIRAGGSPYAANVVGSAIREGGALLVPSLNSKEAIRLGGSSESRHDVVTTTEQRGQDSFRQDNGDKRGIHLVGSDDDDTKTKSSLRSSPLFGAGNNSYKKQVNWIETVTSAAANTFKPNEKGFNAQPGKEIYLDSVGAGGQEVKQKEKKPGKKNSESKQEIQQSEHRRVPRSSDSPSTDSFSMVETPTLASEYEGGCCAAQKLINDGSTFYGSDYDGGCVAVTNIPWELRDQTLNPSNLFPQWEARTIGDSVTYATEYTERSTIAPLMNLFLPVPEVKREPGKSNSRFVESAESLIMSQESGPKPKTGDAIYNYLCLPVPNESMKSSVANTTLIRDSWTCTGTYTSTHGRSQVSGGKSETSQNNDPSTENDIKTSDQSMASQENPSAMSLLGKMAVLQCTAMDQDQSQQTERIPNGGGTYNTSHNSTTASYNTGAHHTMTTQTIQSMQAKKGDYCDWKFKCADFVCPITGVKNPKTIDSDESGKGADDWDLEPTLDNSVESGVEIMSDMVPYEFNSYAPVPKQKKNKSILKKMKTALGRLNCGDRKRRARPAKNYSYESN